MRRGNHVKRERLYYIKRQGTIFASFFQLRWAKRGDDRPIEDGWERIDREYATALAGKERYYQRRCHAIPKGDTYIWPYGITPEQMARFDMGLDFDSIRGYVVVPWGEEEDDC